MNRSAAPTALSACVFPLELPENPVMSAINANLQRRGVHLVRYDWLSSNFERHQVFHVHWPDAVVMGSGRAGAYLKFGLFMGSVYWAKLLGRRIVYTVHNLSSHDRRHPALERLLWKAFLPMVNTFHHMNSASMASLQANSSVRPSSRHVLIPHPHYRDHIAPPPRDEARIAMGLKPEAFVTLLFGQLRPYKGVEGAIEAFRQDAAPDSVLIVAGKPSSPAYASAIRDAVGADPRIVLIPEFIGDETLSRLLAACDLVLLNHRKMNNSGVALMALSADRPILAPPIAAIRDLAKDVGLPWVNTFDGDLDAKSLSRTRASIASIGASDRPDLDRMAPDLVAEQIVHLYRY